MDYLKGWISFVVFFIVGWIYGKLFYSDIDE